MPIKIAYLEIAAVFVVAILVLSNVLAFLYGIETRKARIAFSKTSEVYRTMRDRHFVYLGIFFSSLVVAIGVIEYMTSLRRTAGIASPLTPVHIVHYLLDALYIGSLALAVWYNGLRSDRHDAYVWWLIWPSVAVLVTGLYLYIRLIMM
ncbi:hypothetical protein FJY93_02200 [Candidatus Kaiserbacteria bacterium]|nr:hypothetical protein [Candidatus Kaiserbacteria bacterium]